MRQRPATILWHPVPTTSHYKHPQLGTHTTHTTQIYEAQLSEALGTIDWETVPLLRHRVQALADALSHVTCTRVADKGPTMLFSFCRQWVWDLAHEFLTHEGYNPQPLTSKQTVQTTLRNIILEKRWAPQTLTVHPSLIPAGQSKNAPARHGIMETQCCRYRTIDSVLLFTHRSQGFRSIFAPTHGGTMCFFSCTQNHQPPAMDTRPRRLGVPSYR